MSDLRCLIGRHDWFTYLSGSYGEIQHCHRRCGASRVRWSYYFKERYG